MERYHSYKDSGVKWLGEIPSHWEMLALKHILKLKKDIVGRRSSQYDLLSLTLKGVVKRDMENPEGKFPASFDTYQAVEPNDFIFCNFDNEETPRAVGLSPYKGMITGAYDVLSRKNPKLTDGFLIYYFLYIDDAKRFKPLYKGLRKTVPFDSFMSYKIPVPSLKEQAAIVSYLDTATAKIDAAITQQQKMIDLLNERKQIIINRAVTKGLNPDVKMKDSGVEWIGEVPEHWEIIPLKRISTSTKILVDPQSYKGKMLYEYSMPSFDNMKAPELVSGASLESSKIALSGPTLLVNKLNVHKKRIWYVESPYENSVASTEFIPFKLHNSNPHYIEYYLLSDQVTDYLKNNTFGATNSQRRVAPEIVCSLPMTIPPVQEQQRIVDYLDRLTDSIAVLLEVYNKNISLLQERKQIIINEVVTGKVKVV